MKKVILTIVLSLFLLSGCQKNDMKSSEEFNVVTSFYPLYIFTKNVAKDVPNINVLNMADNHAGCLHDYQLSTSDMKKVEKGDVFITNGAGKETFVEQMIKNKEDIFVVNASEGITLIENKFEDGENEHTWLSITNAIIQVENIKKALSEKDPINKEKYEKSADEYIERLKSLKNELREDLYGIKENKMVTSHDAFSYFAEDFGLEVLDVIQKNAGESPTTKEIKEIITNMKENNIKAIFAEKDFSDKLLETIADETDAKIFLLNLATEGEDSLEAYEKIMKNNIFVIKDAFSEGKNSEISIKEEM